MKNQALLICLGMVIFSCSIFAQDVFVPADQSTINAALSVVGPGGTITITDGGTYTEDVLWDKNCTLTSTGTTPAVIGTQSIQADVTLSNLNLSAVAGANVVDISGDFLQVTISDCDITGGDYGVYADDSADSLVFNMSNCNVSDIGTQGIRLWQLTNLTVNLNDVVIAEAGIRLAKDTEERRALNIRGLTSLVTLQDCTFYSTQDGTEDRLVNIHSYTETLIMDNCLMEVPAGDPDGDGQDARARFGLYIDRGGAYEKNVILRDTKLYGNVHEVSIGQGNPGNITMERCDFTCTGTWKSFQIWEMINGTHTITDSTFVASDDDGEAFFWQQNWGSTATFTNCYFSGGDKGFRLRQNNTGQIQHLTFTECRFANSTIGMAHTDGNETNTTTVFEQCAFEDNTDAIRTQFGGVVFDIRNSVFSGNDYDIHQAAGPNDYLLDGNTFKNTDQDCILLTSGTSNLDATHCTFYNVGGSCIRVESSSAMSGDLLNNLFTEWGAGSYALDLQGNGFLYEDYSVFVDTDNVGSDIQNLILAGALTRGGTTRSGDRLSNCFCDAPGDLSIVKDGLADDIDGAGDYAGSQPVGCEIVSSAALWEDYR